MRAYDRAPGPEGHLLRPREDRNWLSRGGHRPAVQVADAHIETDVVVDLAQAIGQRGGVTDALADKRREMPRDSDGDVAPEALAGAEREDDGCRHADDEQHADGQPANEEPSHEGRQYVRYADIRWSPRGIECAHRYVSNARQPPENRTLPYPGRCDTRRPR